MKRVAAALALAALLAAGAPQVETVGRTRAAIVLPDGPPAGSAILLPGGTTRLTIDSRGETDSGNFLLRIRGAFLDAGFAIAYVEDPADLAPLVARMRRIARPVFYIGTSNGTTVAVHSAADLGSRGPDGIVLTSTVTATSKQFPETAATADLRKIGVPVLFVHNRNDDCRSSPPGGLLGLLARLPRTTSTARIDVASDRTASDPCGPFSPHGYLGIEDAVAERIVAWMRAHGAQGTP